VSAPRKMIRQLPESVALREAALDLVRAAGESPTDDYDLRYLKQWHALDRAAVRFAKARAKVARAALDALSRTEKP
jgi:hypothetical protein